MSTATLGVTLALDSALRRAFSEASIRLRDDTKVSDIITALGTMGVTATVEDGLLYLRQGDTLMHTHAALRSFAANKEHERFFVTDGAHPYQWSREKKVAFIRENGEERYREEVQKPVLKAVRSVLDPNMTRTEYLSLTTKERVSFIREFGELAVRAIMRKAK